MPGLHVRVAGPRGGRDDGGLSVALGRRLHSDGYRAAVLAAEGGVEVGRTLYEGYPISSFSGPKGRLVVVDGMIYGADPKAAASALSGLVPPGAGPGDLDRDALRAWVEGTDGDYVVLLYDRREGVVTVVNDHLGGLPLYYAEDGGALVLSREMDLVAGLLREPRLDRRSLAERLLFRFALGVRTLVEGLRRVPPATVATIDGSTARLSLTRLLDWDLGARPASGETLGECARRLSSLLVEASRARAASFAAAGRVAVVSLSGGLDSRSVAAAFVRAGSAPPAATFVEAGRAGQNRRDVRAAEEVARALGLPWERFALAPGTIEDIERSMRTRGGHAYLPVAHLDAFYRALASRHGAGAVMLTGDGGDKLLPPVVPAGGVGSMGELVGLVLERNAVIGLERLEGLAGVGEGEMRASLAAHLAGYPEADLGLKYLHFVLFERGCNWVFEGMDGSRNHLWRCSPFLSPPFVRYALAVPLAHRERFRLYAEVLRRLSPAAAGVGYANWPIGPGLAAPPGSPAAGAYQRLAEGARRFPALWRALRLLKRPDAYGRHAVSAGEGAALRRALAGRRWARHLPEGALDELFDGGLDRIQFLNLLAVLLYAERLGGAQDPTPAEARAGP